MEESSLVARLGSSLGSLQSDTLYLTYTASALLVATHVVKTLGARDSLITGMGIYCVYALSFVLATLTAVTNDTTLFQDAIVVLAAALEEIDAGFLWTAQGSSARAAEEYTMSAKFNIATSMFSGTVSCTYLTEEVLMQLFSSVMHDLNF